MSASPHSESTERVHVRTLGVADTLRWSWEALRDRPELVGVAAVVNLLPVVGSLGVSSVGAGEPPAVAGWVWPLYLLYLLGTAVVWAVAYASAEDAVANRERPLTDRLVAAARRVPALAVVALPVWTLTALGLALLVLPGIYLFHRLVLSFPACVVDGKGPVAGLRAGWRAGGGNVRKLLGVTVVYLALVGGANVAAGLLGEFALVGALLSAGVSAVLLPLFGVALGHLYLEGSRNR